jgi:D-alanyl-D-alanine carboxypeptidase
VGGSTWESPAATGRRYLVYSITKTFLAVVICRLGLDLDSSIRNWFADPRLPDATLRQLLNHTSGIPDYGRLPAYAEAVRERTDDAWSDEELLDCALREPAEFAPGEGWDYSNTGYLLLRRIVDKVVPGGFAQAVASEVLDPLGLSDTALAVQPVELDDGRRYDPLWVGHRTLVSTTRDQLRFWTALLSGELVPPETFAQLTRFTSIGRAAPGSTRPGYGLGLMLDPDHPGGFLLGHGGGGPGYAAGAFAMLTSDGPVVAVVLTASDTEPAQETALRLLDGAGVRIP